MELADLKSVWKKATEHSEPGYWVSRENISTMIKERSQSTMADMKRALRFKVRTSTAGVLLALTVVIVMLNVNDSPDETYFFGLLDTAEQFATLMGIMGSVLLGFSIMLRIRLRQINQHESLATTLKESISNARAMMKKVMQSGVYSDTLGISVLAIWITYIRLFGNEPFLADSRLLYLLIIALMVPIVMYRLGRSMQSNKYGHFISALDQYLEELDLIELEENEE